MLILISIASFSFPTAIALYWVATNGLNVIQTIIFKKLADKPKKEKKIKKEKVKTVKTKSKGSK